MALLVDTAARSGLLGTLGSAAGAVSGSNEASTIEAATNAMLNRWSMSSFDRTISKFFYLQLVCANQSAVASVSDYRWITLAAKGAIYDEVQVGA